jgi:4-hydroxy-tetrahydrodipicolinate synthase
MHTTTPAAPMTLYAIAPTQFSPDGRVVDGAAMAANMRRLAGAGITRVLLTGAYGEFNALTDAERLDVLDSVRATAVCDSIMACAASLSTAATARLAAAMLGAGADTAMVAPPLACETSERDVLRHFTQLAAAAGGALVIYNNPVFGHDLAPALLGEVMAGGGYAGIKQGTRDTGRLLAGIEAIRACGRPVEVLIASDLTAAVTLAAPVDGLTSTNCWVFPQATITLVEAAGRGDVATMRAVQRALAPYRGALALVGQPAGVKAAMQLRGYAGSAAVRAPYAECTPEQSESIRQALDACDRALASVLAPVEVRA